jgi:hypothetical protein
MDTEKARTAAVVVAVAGSCCVGTTAATTGNECLLVERHRVTTVERERCIIVSYCIVSYWNGGFDSIKNIGECLPLLSLPLNLCTAARTSLLYELIVYVADETRRDDSTKQPNNKHGQGRRTRKIDEQNGDS